MKADILIENYLGTDIYFSTEYGWFYCNVGNSSSDSKVRTHRSKVYEKLQQAMIDEMVSQDIPAYITIYSPSDCSLQKHRVVSRNGDRVITPNGNSYLISEGNCSSSFKYVFDKVFSPEVHAEHKKRKEHLSELRITMNKLTTEINRSRKDMRIFINSLTKL